VVAVLASALLTACAGPAAAAPSVSGCRVFPPATASNRGTYADFNRDVSGSPVHPRSAAYVRAIGPGNLHPDFGGPFGIPFAVVSASEPARPVRFTAYGSESDRGPYPIPPWAPVEGGSDRHVLVLQRGRCRLFELFAARFDPAARRWSAASGAIFDLRSGRRRPEGWTSADAAGLPILPGLVRFGEVQSGRIDHAIRVTVPRTQSAHLHPATHDASSSGDPNLPPMGLRLRLRASYPIGGFPRQSRIVLTALKRYGMIVADNGSGWYLTGQRHRGWSVADLDALKRVPGSAFEAVATGQPVLPRT
jgi:hypothetical protein